MSELNEVQVRELKEIREHGEALWKLVKRLYGSDFCTAEYLAANGGSSNDGRWLSIGMTHLQQGLMALERAVRGDKHF